MRLRLHPRLTDDREQRAMEESRSWAGHGYERQQLGSSREA
jgi:hypothetical protein